MAETDDMRPYAFVGPSLMHEVLGRPSGTTLGIVHA
jgi:hypothetical protein